MWKRVMFSDECSVDHTLDPITKWVFRYGHEKWDKNCIAPYKKSGAVRVMVWGIIAGHIKGPLRWCQGSMNSIKYLDILQDVLPDFWSKVSYIHGESEGWREIECPFMQDNAPIHKARVVMEWLEEEEFVVLKWPPTRQIST